MTLVVFSWEIGSIFSKRSDEYFDGERIVDENSSDPDVDRLRSGIIFWQGIIALYYLLPILLDAFIQRVAPTNILAPLAAAGACISPNSLCVATFSFCYTHIALPKTYVALATIEMITLTVLIVLADAVASTDFAGFRKSKNMNKNFKKTKLKVR
eukprot:g5516.t1